MKEILLNWIDTPIKQNILICEENYSMYLGDPEFILLGIIEATWRKELVCKYLDSPTDQTIINFFSDLYTKSKEESSLFKVEKRVLKKLLKMFNLDTIYKL